MRRSLACSALACCLALLLAPAVLAQLNLNGSADHDALQAQLAAEGWREIVPGFLERQLPGQPIETIAFGEEGLAQAIQQLRNRFGALLEQYGKSPTRELESALSELRAQITELEQALTNRPGGLPELNLGCDISFGCNAAAYPLTSVQGTGANSSAYFTNNCAYQGSVYADAYASTAAGSSFQANSGNGASVSRSASASSAGGPSCSSSAYSSASSTSLGIFYSCSHSNGICPEPISLPVVSISGPGVVWISGYNCETVYWYATASGGTSPYSYAWTIYGYGAGTGSSTSMTFCGSNYTYTDYVPVSVTVTDSASQTDSDSMTTTIYYQGGGCGWEQYLTGLAIPCDYY